MARRTLNRLSPIVLRKLLPGKYCDGGNLYFCVEKTKAGSLSRAFKFRIYMHRKEQWMGLDALHEATLAEARKKATGVLRQPVDGVSFWVAREETADRVRQRVEAVLGSAKAQGFRTGDNPARWRGHLEDILPARETKSDEDAEHAIAALHRD